VIRVLIPKAEMVIHEPIVVPAGVQLVGDVTVTCCDCCDWDGKNMVEGSYDSAEPILSLSESMPVSGFTLLKYNQRIEL
jgi:hypothetical protein